MRMGVEKRGISDSNSGEFERGITTTKTITAKSHGNRFYSRVFKWVEIKILHRIFNLTKILFFNFPT